jgi:hypothetical protein
VIHDWPDAEARKILKNLREAAAAASKLIIFDTQAIHTCEDPSSSTKGKGLVPYPLLANLGIGGVGFATALDMQVVLPSSPFQFRLLTCVFLQMLSMFDAKERTEEEFRQLGAECGWKLESSKAGSLCTFVFSAA